MGDWMLAIVEIHLRRRYGAFRRFYHGFIAAYRRLSSVAVLWRYNLSGAQVLLAL